VKFLRREDLIEDDPSSLVAAPKKPQTIPAHLTIDEMRTLLEMPDASNPLGRRDRLLFDCGSRPARRHGDNDRLRTDHAAPPAPKVVPRVQPVRPLDPVVAARAIETQRSTGA